MTLAALEPNGRYGELTDCEFPTIDLVYFLAERAKAKGHDVSSVEAWIRVALTDFKSLRESVSDAATKSDLKVLFDAAQSHIDAMMALFGDEPRGVYSLVINWNDRDSDEGTFGETVRAFDDTHAEHLVRAAMEQSEDGIYHDGIYGTVVERFEGATWEAKALETALRGVIAGIEGKEIAVFNAKLAEAKTVLARIDAI